MKFICVLSAVVCALAIGASIRLLAAPPNAGEANAAAPNAAENDGQKFFLESVAPVFERRCVTCHNDNDRKGGFSIQTAGEVVDLGYLVPGDVENSYLVEMITPDKLGAAKMPKKSDPLAAAELAAIRRWIAAGAAWPAGHKLQEARVIDRDWWSFKPLAKPNVPALHADDASRSHNAIDAFWLAKLRERNLAPSPEADRRTLMRRAYVDLLGLLPAPEEVEAFANDPDPQAYEKLIDRLLASPHYGERWARHWLDVVHYGDTHGFDKDKLRLHAWPYRDYVIRSFNDDKPYGQFAREQIAGDVLYPESPDAIPALGMLAAGPWDFVGQVEVSEATPDGAIARNLDRDDIVATVMNAFVSMTVQCARCHNHKFDPIGQEDYYGLQAVFAAVDRANRPYDADAETAKRRAELNAEKRGLEGRLSHAEASPQNEELAARLREVVRELESLPPQQIVYAAATHFAPESQFRPTEGKPREIYLLRRGEEKSPDKERGLVPPGALEVIEGLPARFALPDDHDESARRAALAEWIAHRDNPLVWRSIVNRVWYYHFGRGIVESPNDFGRMGAEPSHPELLDYLAAEFRDGGELIDGAQSLKALHRAIMLSGAYRQTSSDHTEFAKIDGGNQFLWRQNRRRLEAEALRDATLQLAGKLDRTMGGPGFRNFDFKDDHSPGYFHNRHDPDDPASWRRSIYRVITRSVPDPFMETLDCADPSIVVDRRNDTLTALHALALLNNKFMVRMSEHFAERLQTEAEGLEAQITRGFELAFQREPSEEERKLLTDYAKEHGLPNACRLLFNTNELMFID